MVCDEEEVTLTTSRFPPWRRRRMFDMVVFSDSNRQVSLIESKRIAMSVNDLNIVRDRTLQLIS